MSKQAYDKDGNKVKFAIYDDDYVLEPEPSVLEYAVVIILTIISLVGMLFGKKIQSDKENSNGRTA